jgi:hypothetical protein
MKDVMPSGLNRGLVTSFFGMQRGNSVGKQLLIYLNW